MSLDVGSLESNRLLIQANGESAYGALVAMVGKHLVREVPIAGHSSPRKVRELDADGLQDLVMERRREVGINEFVGDLLREVRVGSQRFVDVARTTES